MLFTQTLLVLSNLHNILFDLGFPCGSAGKESTCNVGGLGLIARLGWSPRKGKGYSLQYPGLVNSMDCIVHGVAKSRTWLSDFHFTSLHFTSLHFYLTYLEQNPWFQTYFSLDNAFDLCNNEARRVCPYLDKIFCHLNFKFHNVLRLLLSSVSLFAIWW